MYSDLQNSQVIFQIQFPVCVGGFQLLVAHCPPAQIPQFQHVL